MTTLEVDHLFEDPYQDARYSIVVPIDHSVDKLVNTVTKHPHQRFVGRKIRRRCEVDDGKKKKMYRSFEGKVKYYNGKRDSCFTCNTRLMENMRRWTFTN